jgi:hypothetical protein
LSDREKCPTCRTSRDPLEILYCDQCGHKMCTECSGVRDDGAIICRTCERGWESRKRREGK